MGFLLHVKEGAQKMTRDDSSDPGTEFLEVTWHSRLRLYQAALTFESGQVFWFYGCPR